MTWQFEIGFALGNIAPILMGLIVRWTLERHPEWLK
jgi:hypothetical protein